MFSKLVMREGEREYSGDAGKGGRMVGYGYTTKHVPSDYSGVLWIELDASGAWKLQLAKEIKEAGLSIDMNDAI
jgi:hypothetical protein